IPLVGGRNLHAVWDSPFGTTRTFGADVLRRTATILADRSLVSAGARAMQNLNAVDWLQESSELAKRVAYHQNILTVVRAAEKQPDQALPKIALPDSYFNQLGAVARRRAVEAGFRLGRLLEVECRP
ncbi:MAG: S1/P1 nuclease, partial [Planctomycetaceae bacterium]